MEWDIFHHWDNTDAEFLRDGPYYSSITKISNNTRKTVKIKCIIKLETSKAYLVNRKGGKYWVPKSQILSISNSKTDGYKIISLPQWLLLKLKRIE